MTGALAFPFLLAIFIYLFFSSEKQNKVVQDSFVIDPAALGITNIKDMTFLHGYHEPTLLVLYEPMHTWVGCGVPLNFAPSLLSSMPPQIIIGAWPRIKIHLSYQLFHCISVLAHLARILQRRIR